MNLHHLSIFYAVARTGSVSRGANELMISKPAVSKQLRLFERSFKVVLFDRHPKGVSLTSEGIVLADYAARIFSLLGEAESVMSEVASLKQGRLSIGASPNVGVYVMPRAMVNFRQQHPLVRFHAETEGTPVLCQRLLDGAIDVAISEAPIVQPGLTSKKLLIDELVPVVSSHHAFAKKSKISASEFCQQPFIARQVESDAGSLVEKTLAARGIYFNPVLTVSSTEAIKQAVTARVGVAMVSRLAIGVEVKANLITQLKIKGLSIPYPIFEVVKKGKSKSRLAGLFLTMLAGCFADGA